MEAELNAIVLTLKELATRQAEIMKRLEEIGERLNELQVEVNANVSSNQGI